MHRSDEVVDFNCSISIRIASVARIGFVGWLQVRLLRGTLRATATVAGATTQAADAAKTAVEVAEAALRFEQRPWLVPTGGGELIPGTNPETGKPMLLGRVDLKNSGRTPAQQITITVQGETSNWSGGPRQIVTWGQSQVISKVGAVGPGVVHAHWVVLPPWDGSEHGGVFDTGLRKFRLYGTIKYKGHRIDALNPPHPHFYETKFTLLWLGPGKPFSIEGPHNDCT